MAKKKSMDADRNRIAHAAALALERSASGPSDPSGGESLVEYHLSSQVADPLRRRIRGNWSVVEHRLGDQAFLDRFAERALKGLPLLEPEYRAEYVFKDGICLKRVEITGTVDLEEGSSPYAYRMRVASSWDLDGPDRLRISVEQGYQYTSLGGLPAAVLDLDEPPAPSAVSFHFEGAVLVLEEGEDIKRLERLG